MALRKLIGVVVGLALAVSVGSADTVALNPNQPDRYVVQTGDTLWDIAERFLRDPWLWPEVWYVNPQIENPHLIYPGDTIALTYDAEGRPRLTVQRAGQPTVKLSPQIREVQLEQAIPTIPLNEIQPFLTRPLVVGEPELEAAPYVVAAAGEHLLGSPGGASGQLFYARQLENTHENYSIYRKGVEYRQPAADGGPGKLYGRPKGELLGYEAVFVGDAVLEESGDPATLQVVDVTREVAVGDRLMPIEEQAFDPHFLPHAPSSDLEGSILSVHDGVQQIGRYSVVAINLGERDGMEAGHVLEIWQKGETVVDPVSKRPDEKVTLPDERAGLLMVFRTFDRVSYALVMRAHTNIRTYDKVRTPRRKT